MLMARPRQHTVRKGPRSRLGIVELAEANILAASIAADDEDLAGLEQNGFVLIPREVQ